MGSVWLVIWMEKLILNVMLDFFREKDEIDRKILRFKIL